MTLRHFTRRKKTLVPPVKDEPRTTIERSVSGRGILPDGSGRMIDRDPREIPPPDLSRERSSSGIGSARE